MHERQRATERERENASKEWLITERIPGFENGMEKREEKEREMWPNPCVSNSIKTAYTHKLNCVLQTW